jgi:hypothetical protein
MIFKNLVLQALGIIRIRFLQKKYFKKMHACVPLISHEFEDLCCRVAIKIILDYALLFIFPKILENCTVIYESTVSYFDIF